MIVCPDSLVPWYHDLIVHNRDVNVADEKAFPDPTIIVHAYLHPQNERHVVVRLNRRLPLGDDRWNNVTEHDTASSLG